MDTGRKGLRCEVVAVLVDRLGHSPDRIAVRALLAVHALGMQPAVEALLGAVTDHLRGDVNGQLSFVDQRDLLVALAAVPAPRFWRREASR